MRVSARIGKALCTSLTCLAALGNATMAPAQTGGELSRLRLSCSDFTKSRDNTWSPLRPIIVGTVAVNPGSSYRAGEFVGGTDLGAILDGECVQSAPPGMPADPSPTPNG